MIKTSVGSQACAACRFQRRKCAPNCPLAPYFPANQQRDFLNSHKLFGVSNIIKIIKNLNPQQRAIAMKSIIFQANMRASDPVGGCLRYITHLEKQIDDCRAQLEIVLKHLSVCKTRQRAVIEDQAGPSSNQGGDDSSVLTEGLNDTVTQNNDVDEDIKPLLDGFNETEAASSSSFDSKDSIQCRYQVKKEGGSILEDFKDAACLTNGKK